MLGQGKPAERERRDWTIVVIILLLGFLFVILAGEWAVRFSPVWKLDANMQSNLDPDSDFLTNRPVGFFEPLDPSILTQPVWINIFLTPGAFFETRPPNIPNTPVPTNTLVTTVSRTPTEPAPSTNTPTNTIRYIPPPPTQTSTPRPPGTNTPLLTAIPVDLQITKTDSTVTYTAGAPVTYTIMVTNNGPNNVTGATINDLKPAQVTTWGWCIAPCTPVANANTNLTNTFNLASGATVTYMVLANTNPAATVTDNLVNIASVSVPSGYMDTVPGNNSATDTDTPVFSADLSITKTDDSTHYDANATKTYVIEVINYGPSNVTGATVTDSTLTNATNANIASDANWTCSGAGGGTCSANSGSGNISDSVNLPAGASVTYVVAITVVASPSGDLANTASVSSSIDPNNTNDSATDIDTLITASIPPLEFGGPPDNGTYNLPAGDTLTISINLTADADPEWDLVYYEFSLASFPPPDTFDGIWLDWIIIEISDGSNWYSIFNWGDNIRNTNTNVDYTILTLPAPPPNPEEMDQRPIASSDLYLSSSGYATGIAIDIDSMVPAGTYTYIRFRAPTGDTDGQLEIDALEVLP